MNARFAIVALAALGCAGAVTAQEAMSDEWMRIASTSAPEAVVAETGFARPIEMRFADGASVRARMDVLFELAQARASGEYAQINAEVSSLGSASAVLLATGR